MSVKGTGQEPIRPERQSIREGSSDLAQKVESEGGKLEEILSKQPARFRGIPILGRLEAFFTNQSAKKEYVENLQDTFVGNAIWQGFDRKKAEATYTNFVKPKLLKMSLEECADFEHFIQTEMGVTYLMQPLIQQPDAKGLIHFRNEIDHIIQIRKRGNFKSLIQAFSYIPRAAKIIDRLRPEDKLAYFKAWIQAEKEDPAQFSAFVKAYGKHLALMEETQAKRPEIFDQGSQAEDALRKSFRNLQETFPMQIKEIELFDLAMRDATVVLNRQVLQYSIAGLYLGPTNKGGVRSVPALTARCSIFGEDAPFGITNQISIPFTLPNVNEGREEEVIENFQATTEVYVTDPFSMETRSIRLPLPISGSVTVGEARKKLQLLFETVNNHDRFDETYDSLDLPPEQKEKIRKDFFAFDDQFGQEFGRALGDFNSTPTVPRESWARESQSIAALLSDPNSKEKALEAAKTQNIFLLEDGTLSLLPKGPGEIHRDIGTLSPAERDAAAKLFFGEFLYSIPVTLKYPRNSTLEMKTYEEKIDGQSPYLVMETTFTKEEGKTFNRKSYYDLENRTPEEVKKALVESKLFERDLLLAKAEFLEKYAEL